ncbi:MAG TPA: DUF3617 domain-containing protein [Rhizomicrobium sp.]|jgi:hypothetical protein|nr:DUF3617 domain-containing protein [Rhizomicrobium sp.]
MKKIGLVAAAIILAPGAAFAGHGKAGLWNVSTTMDMGGMQVSPEAMARMKAMGVKMPSAQTFSSQICMTQAEVDSDKLPPMGRNDTGCTNHIVSQTGTAITAEMVCNGEMKGTGRLQIAYSNPEHYAGTYSFKGAVHGHDMSTTSSFKGDWVKVDCGAMKPRKP